MFPKDKTEGGSTKSALFPAYPGVSLPTLLWHIIIARFDTSQPPCTHSFWPNIVCALSNWIFTGIPAILINWPVPYRRYITLAAVISSTIYHLAEVKSRLPGLPWLRKHASLLIQLDRLCTVIAGFEVVKTLFFQTAPFNWLALVVGLVGLVSGVISERHIGWQFVFWHSIWHNAAFLMLILV